MKLDEQTALAVQAWQRFDKAVGDELVRAVAGAFAVVACSDGELAEEEVEQFVRFAREHEAFEALDRDALEAAFRSLCEALFTDLEVGRRHALAEAAHVRRNPELAHLVLEAGRIALWADHRETKAEREALGLLAEALGIDLLRLPRQAR